MRLPKRFPTVVQFPAWRAQMARALCTVARLTSDAERKQVIAWFRECESKTFDQLVDVGDARFHGLDAQLSLRLVPLMPSDLQEE
eukprot:8971731-Lingulodinium_polyedra.AAC.1